MVSIAKGLQLEKMRTLLEEHGVQPASQKSIHYFNVRSHAGIKVNLSSSSIPQKLRDAHTWLYSNDRSSYAKSVLPQYKI